MRKKSLRTIRIVRKRTKLDKLDYFFSWHRRDDAQEMNAVGEEGKADA